MVKVGIVTVSYNGMGDTLELLESGKKLETEGMEVRWIVVDNGSTDKLVENVQKMYPKVDVVQTGENLGFTGGYNRGLRYAYAMGADYVLIINNDTTIADKDVLEKMLETMEKAGVGVVAPKIWFEPGFEFHKDRYEKKDEGKVMWYAGGDFDWDNLMSKHRGIDEVDTGRYGGVEEVDFVSGCCFLIRREVLKEVGYLDERLFAYFEDNDWIVRVMRAGWKLVYDGRVGIYHKVSRTAGIGSPAADYYITRNRLEFAKSYARWRTKWSVAKEAVRMLVAGREWQRRGVVDWMRGKWGAMEKKEAGRTEWLVKVSIAIVNYKTKTFTNKLLQSIAKYCPEAEVVVLDNGSGEDFAVKKFISSPVNLGFSGGYNLAMDACRGEYVLMLNSDIEVRKGAVKALVRVAAETGGVVAGKLILPDKSVQKSAFHLPTIGGAVREYFGGVEGAYFAYLPAGRKTCRVEGAVMACLLIPRAVLNKVGRLNEGTFMYFEDVEYCRRLGRAGIPIYYVPGAVFDHHHGAASKKLGEGEAQKKATAATKWYHGDAYDWLLTMVLRLGRKWQRVALWYNNGRPKA